MDLAAFHFLRPYWLLALPPLAWLLWRLARHQRRPSPWEKHCDPQLRPWILVHADSERSHRALAGLAAGGLLVVLALAGPTWQQLPAASHHAQPRVYLLDVSRSMQADDIKPSRLERAKQKLLAMLGDDPAALIAYAGSAHPLTPLAHDPAIVANLVPALDPELMPLPGSDAASALAAAVTLLEHYPARQAQVILITDGLAQPERALRQARRLRQAGHRLSVLAVASQQGAKVPGMRDSDGRAVHSRLQAVPLQALATAGGGRYQEVQHDDSDVQALLHDPPAASLASPQRFDQWRDQGPWLLLLALPLIALGYRRGWLAGVLALTFLLPPAPLLQAAETDPRIAMTLFRAGDYARAAERFQDPAWRASAYYRAGDYARAAAIFRRLDGADNRYNLGNALVHQGKLEEALRAYDEALALDPRHQDARFNRRLVQDWLEAGHSPSPPAPAPVGPSTRRGDGGRAPAATPAPADPPRSQNLRDDPAELLRQIMWRQYHAQGQPAATTPPW